MLPSPRTDRVAQNMSFFILELCLLLLVRGALGSEFPDRTCCDSVPPTLPTSTSVTQATLRKLSYVAYEDTEEPSCLYGQDRCLKDENCKSYLYLLPKICGPELLACAAMHPQKCHILLAKLKTFDYIQNCTCRTGDPNCLNFQLKIFQNPCEFVQERQMPISCNDAFKACASDKYGCSAYYSQFKRACPKSENKCLAKNRSACSEALEFLVEFPIFRCMCKTHELDREVNALLFDSVSAKRRGSLKCSEVLDELYNHPCVSPRKVSHAPQIEKEQALCHEALQGCEKDSDCRPALNNFMLWCEHPLCEQERCLAELQRFYASIDIRKRVDIAFCVCRQNDPNGECLTAMRKLHPRCAEGPTGKEVKTCSQISRKCRNERTCRKKLEDYERSCAADTMTGKCLGMHRGCQHAVSNLLGTELHASCVCKGTDFISKPDCGHWQRLLWANPCVIESHLALQMEIRVKGDVINNIFPTIPFTSTTTTPAMTTTSTSSTTPPSVLTLLPYFASMEDKREYGSDSRVIEVIPSTQEDESDYCQYSMDDGDGDVQWLKIHQGKWRKVESHSHGDCYNLCYCEPSLISGGKPKLECSTVDCISSQGCTTGQATFPHLSPFFKAHQGECICFSGKFICQRPMKGKNFVCKSLQDLEPGVFLFLGYNPRRLQVLSKRNKVSEIEILMEIEKILAREYEFQCLLNLYQHFSENLIFKVETEFPENESDSLSHAQKIQACIKSLKMLEKHISEGHEFTKADAYLSMLILAEVLEPHIYSYASPVFSAGLCIQTGFLSLVLSVWFAYLHTHSILLTDS